MPWRKQAVHVFCPRLPLATYCGKHEMFEDVIRQAVQLRLDHKRSSLSQHHHEAGRFVFPRPGSIKGRSQSHRLKMRWTDLGWLRTTNIRVPTLNCSSANKSNKHGLRHHLKKNPKVFAENRNPGRLCRQETTVVDLTKEMLKRLQSATEAAGATPPSKANRVRFPSGSFLDFHIWESCRTTPLFSVFPRGSPVSYTVKKLSLRLLISGAAPCWTSAFMTSILRAAQTLRGWKSLDRETAHPSSSLPRSDGGTLRNSPPLMSVSGDRITIHSGWSEPRVTGAYSFFSREPCIILINRPTPPAFSKEACRKFSSLMLPRNIDIYEASVRPSVMKTYDDVCSPPVGLATDI
ncbi:hypothetical protein PR048_024836 [Dryococelus australis]|uniref:Uncharacterized protein n=1 Tax=Dryococelus australis TaxID=614101 RepID=A0ABQ9GPS4_9NEOP|nr:hypothetical protein PR048_024836 [Dryococelus australis]